jgi:hypothetical protein
MIKDNIPPLRRLVRRHNPAKREAGIKKNPPTHVEGFYIYYFINIYPIEK